MLRGLYTAAAGMLTQQRRHDIITNNISNLNTPGYKEQNAVARSFPEMLISLVNGGEGQQSRSIGRLNSGVMVEEILPIFTQGDLQETGNPADFALISDIRVIEDVDGEEVQIDFNASGRGVNEDGETVYQPLAFFTVWNEAGEERYTRNGKFYVDPEGELRTTDGLRVIGVDGQPIEIDRPIDQVTMAPSGLLLDAITGQPLDGDPNLLISQVNEPFNLVREGNGYFRLENADENPAIPVVNPENVVIQQGFIERSNVDPTQSTVDLMTALRTYEANQKVIQYYDRSLEKAVNEIGRV